MKVFIGCSAEVSIDKKYIDLAYHVSRMFYNRKYDLIYGAASFSMMGKCYDVFADDLFNSANNIYAYTVKKYEDDIENLDKAKCFIEEDCFTRTGNMYKLADIILILPGGLGSLAEFAICLEQLRTFEDNKKIILFNQDGYYDKLLEWYNAGVEKKFIKPTMTEYFTVVNNIESLLLETAQFEEKLRSEE